jgi:hypothetical protein
MPPLPLKACFVGQTHNHDGTHLGQHRHSENCSEKTLGAANKMMANNPQITQRATL